MKYFCFFLSTLSFLVTKTLAMASTPNQVQQYPPEFVKNYNLECIQTSMGEGLDEIGAKKLCNCTLNRFQQQYSLTEFKQIMAASANNQQAQNNLVEVGQVCFEQVLYEE